MTAKNVPAHSETVPTGPDHIAPAKGAGSKMWMQGLGCGALLTFAAPTALMLGVLLAPAVLCLVVEPGPDRGQPRAVALGCAAASFGPVWHLWLAGDTLAQTFASLADLQTIILAWGAGACAWALCQVLPVVVRSGWDMAAGKKIREIEAELAQCQKDWRLDEEPSQSGPIGG